MKFSRVAAFLVLPLLAVATPAPVPVAEPEPVAVELVERSCAAPALPVCCEQLILVSPQVSSLVFRNLYPTLR